MPLTYTNWLPLVALLLMVTVAFFVFRAVPTVGAKTTVIVQLPSAGSVPPFTQEPPVVSRN